MPIACVVFFLMPLHFSFKVRKMIYFISIISIVLIAIAEYFLYTYLASTSNLLNGLYNGIIGLTFFVLFFYRHINQIVSKKSDLSFN